MTEPEPDWKEKLRERSAMHQKLPEFCDPLKEPEKIEPVHEHKEFSAALKIGNAAKVSNERKLENQRKRRRRNHRIDYYVSKEALDIIDALTFPNPGGDRSSIINKLVLAGAKKASGILPADARGRACASGSEE